MFPQRSHCLGMDFKEEEVKASLDDGSIEPPNVAHISPIFSAHYEKTLIFRQEFKHYI